MSPAREQSLYSEFKTILKSLSFDEGDSERGMLLVDSTCQGSEERIQKDRESGDSVILVLDESEMLPRPEDLECVDDILVYPFRPAEVLSKVRGHFLRQDAELLRRETQAVSQRLIAGNEKLEEMLRAKSPRNFSGIKGFNVMSRHLTGLKPGGDYFDVFETRDRKHINFLLADSSSYGVSSALLGAILTSSAKIASDAQMSTGQWVKAIYEELKASLEPSEHLSIFFGRINRRDFSFKYQLFGSIEAFVVEQSGVAHHLKKHGGTIGHEGAPSESNETEIRLDAKDRIVLLSDGFVDGVGGSFEVEKVFQEKLKEDPFYLVNELAFRIKSKLAEGETFPGEDCSAIVIDVDERVLRLAG